MKKEKNELKGFSQRSNLGCCLGGFFFKEYKFKTSSKNHTEADSTKVNPEQKVPIKDDLNKENINQNKEASLEKKEPDVNFESAKFKELNCLEPPNFNFNPNLPPRPPFPPPYSVIPLLEFDGPKNKDHYSTKGFPSSSLIHNIEADTTYRVGKLLGKGGFAKCFELTDDDTEKVFAGKIISKICLTKVKQKEKIIKEIELHSSLRHRHIVRFHTSFEDCSNVYIVLEHCSRKSLLHVLKARKTLTECETRYFTRQLLDGVAYIHSQHIIHRDLKLGNMLLNERMMVKIADFGLATKVEYTGEMKTTVCGTPNYIAPEVLQKRGHSYEADIWAVGCIIYALLVGQPPFETHSLKETYMRITNNVFKVPSSVSPVAKELITQLLKPHPSQRPLLPHIIAHPYFTHHFTPKHLPTSSCDHEPRISDLKKAARSKSENYKRTNPNNFVEGSNNNNNNNNNNLKPKKGYRSTVNYCPTPQKSGNRDSVKRNNIVDNNNNNNNNIEPTNSVNNDEKATSCQNNFKRRSKSSHPKVIYTSSTRSSSAAVAASRGGAPDDDHGDVTDGAIAALIAKNTASEQADNIFKYGKTSTFHLYEALNYCLNNIGSEAATRATPLRHHTTTTWITKWVDYSNKYGFGFQLSDRNVGILFNDTTRMIISTDKRTLAYNDLSNKTILYPINTTPTSLRKKVTLLMYFSQYMDEHLIHGAEPANENNADVAKKKACTCGRVFVRKWFRTDAAIVMQLSNGTIQVNFLSDHTKLIVSCENHEYVITYINHHRSALSFPLHSIYLRGCDNDLVERLKFTRKMVESIVNISGETV